MQCPCSAGGVGQKSLRLICLIATILAVTSRLGQPLAGSDDFVLSPSEKAQLIGSVRVCVWVCLKNRATDIDLCLVEQIKLFPHACTHFSMAECASVCSEHVFVWGLFVCVCVHDMASWFLGQTASFCACHILLSVADTASLIPCIHLSPPTSIQTLINGISENGIWFITPDYTHTQEKEDTTNSTHTHKHSYFWCSAKT